jgi:hypothetical protein
MKLKLTLGLALLAASIFAGTAFSQSTSSEDVIILLHTDPDQTQRYIAINRSERDLVDCHLAGGDTEVPFDDELYRKIVETQEDGANICNH